MGQSPGENAVPCRRRFMSYNAKGLWKTIILAKISRTTKGRGRNRASCRRTRAGGIDGRDGRHAPAAPPRLAAAGAVRRHVLHHLPRRAGSTRPIARAAGNTPPPLMTILSATRWAISSRPGAIGVYASFPYFHSHAARALRHLRRRDRHEFADHRSPGLVRHRHHRAVGRAGAHDHLLRVGIPWSMELESRGCCLNQSATPVWCGCRSLFQWMTIGCTRPIPHGYVLDFHPLA